MTVNSDDVKILKELVSKYRDQLLKNEAQVRYYLVNRILRKLGWDPEDPELVVPEEKTSEGFPDYVLMQKPLNPIQLFPKNQNIHAMK